MAGKAAWIARALPLEGDGPHYPLVGEVARRDIVSECRLGTHVADSRAAIEESGQSYCVVLNDHDILMGRLRRKHFATSDGEEVVENVMEIGPTTVRPTSSAADLLKRMEARDVPAVLVTSANGRFVGIARRTEIEKLVRASEAAEHAALGRR